MADTHGLTCPCTLCTGIRASLEDPAGFDERMHRQVTSAMFWKIVAPQIHEHWQHVLSEAFRITTNVGGMDSIIRLQSQRLWKDCWRDGPDVDAW